MQKISLIFNSSLSSQWGPSLAAFSAPGDLEYDKARTIWNATIEYPFSQGDPGSIYAVLAPAVRR